MIEWFLSLSVFEIVGLSILGLGLLVVVFLFFYFLLRILVGWRTLKNIKDDKERGSLKIEIIKTVASILGGMFFILTIVVAFLNYRVTQEKHTTDLYTKAIDQLGGKTLEVRLGGIYALERIARDSEKDHGPIIEVLTAYVRANAPWRPEEFAEVQKKRPWAKNRPVNILGDIFTKEGGLAPGQGEPWELTKFLKRQQVFQAELAKIPPADADIQVALTVIGRRSRTIEKAKAQPLDLTKTDLRKADLRKAHLEGAHLWKANLEGVILDKAHLEGTDLRGSHMAGVLLREAHLEKADLREAHLVGADLMGTNLEGAKLQLAHLEGAFLREAHLVGAKLQEAHLEGAFLSGARLEGAILSETHLEGANLIWAEGLTEKQIRQAIIDENTLLPYHLKHLEKSGGTTQKKGESKKEE